jgi:peptide/nickel transport system permease protein
VDEEVAEANGSGVATLVEASPDDKTIPAGLRAQKGWRGLLTELWSDKAGLVGLIFLVLLVLAAIFAPLVAPHDPAVQSLRDRLMPPVWQEGGSWSHILGTDRLGYDILSRIIFGSRVSLIVGVAVVLISGSFGVVMGLVSGYKGKRVDSLIMGLVDTQVAFPGLLLALLILAVVGPSVRTVILVLSINGWMVYARTTRGIVLSVKENPYVEAAEMVGARPRRVIFRHILPNLSSPLLTLGVLEFARIVLAEAALSYLGLGVQFPDTSWGLDVARGQDLIFDSWWLVTLPGMAIALTVLATNLVASWLRVAADPQEREKRFAATAVSTQGA